MKKREDERSSKYTVQLASLQLRTNSLKTSVCLSACHTFFIMFLSSYHCEIFRNYYHWQMWYPCKCSRSKVKETEVKTNFAPIWTFLDCNSSLNSQMATKWCTKLHGNGIEELPYCFSRSFWTNFKVTWAETLMILTRIGCFWTVTPV